MARINTHGPHRQTLALMQINLQITISNMIQFDALQIGIVGLQSQQPIAAAQFRAFFFLFLLVSFFIIHFCLLFPVINYYVERTLY